MAISMPRREFLQRISATTASLAFISPYTAFAFARKQKSDTNDLLSFTQLNGLGPKIDVQLINQNHVALHGEHQLAAHMTDANHQQYVMTLLREMANQQGNQWDDDDRLLWTYQHYGRCGHTSHCYRLLDYCMTAQEYLYNTLNGLLETKINWQVLTEDVAHSAANQNNFHGFIGRYTYLVHRIIPITKEGDARDFGLVSATPVNRAINFTTSAGDNDPNSSLIYIIPGTTSLISPFSELLHLTTHVSSRRLAGELEAIYGKEQAEATSHIISEAITESAAILTAQKYITQIRHGERLEVVNDHAKNLSQNYSLIPRTISYMLRYGVQHTLDTFTTDPLYLVNRINNAHNNKKYVNL